MRISPEELSQKLQRALAPVYLIGGDEPLQLGEALAAVRDQARARGYSERRLFEPSKDFNWQTLLDAADSPSLFAARRVLEVRLGADGPGREGSEALRRYCARPAPDAILLIGAPALSWKDMKTQWVATIDQLGVVVLVRKIEGAALVPWLERRLRARGFVPAPEVAPLLAERVEGHLLAAEQEIAKLALLREPGPLGAEELLAAVGDSARFDPFELATAALAGERARVWRIVRGLAAEEIAPALAVWALTRESRALAALAYAQRARQDVQQVFVAHQIWEARRPKLLAALKRHALHSLWQLLLDCAHADRIVKGRAPGDAWSAVARIADRLASSG